MEIKEATTPDSVSVDCKAAPLIEGLYRR